MVRVNRLRRALRRWHRAVALTVGGLFAFSGLSGAVLVYHDALDRGLNPDLLATTCTTADRLPLQRLVDAAIASGSPSDRVARIDLPTAVGEPVEVRLTGPDTAAATVVFVEPCTGRVMGRRGQGAGVLNWVYRAHHTLLLGDVGEGLLVGAAVLLLLVIVSGVVTWWPGLGRLHQAVRFRWWHAAGVRVTDLHRSVGALVAVILVVSALTGVGMILQGRLNVWFSDLGWVRPISEVSASQQIHDRLRDPMSLDAVVTLAERLVAGDVRRVYLPAAGSAVYRVIVRQADDPRWSSGSGRVWIDGDRHRPTGSLGLADLRPAERLLTWLFPLHNGEAFGALGKLLVLIAGLSLPVLYGTGLWLWWHRRGQRGRSASGCDSR